jgi:DnaJ-class molecular chaperone
MVRDGAGLRHSWHLKVLSASRGNGVIERAPHHGGMSHSINEQAQHCSRRGEEASESCTRVHRRFREGGEQMRCP